jgi:ketosteroid isomerase-like protein
MGYTPALRGRRPPRPPLACAFLLTTLVACDGGADGPTPEPAPREAPTAEAGTAAAPPAALSEASDRFAAAWDGDDPAAVARFFTEDATATVADATLTGRDDITAGWIVPALPIISNLRLTDEWIRPVGGGWRSEGVYTHDARLPGAEAVSDQRGRYSFTWTRDAHGHWLLRSFEVHPDEVGGPGVGGPGEPAR